MNNNAALYTKLKFYFNKIKTQKDSGISSVTVGRPLNMNHIFGILIFFYTSIANYVKKKNLSALRCRGNLAGETVFFRQFKQTRNNLLPHPTLYVFSIKCTESR